MPDELGSIGNPVGSNRHQEGCDATYRDYTMSPAVWVYRDHEGPCRCRCGTPVWQESEGCAWHEARFG